MTGTTRARLPSTATRLLSSNNSHDDDTIFALSAGIGTEGSGATAVAVIRILGPQSHDVLRRLLLLPSQDDETVEGQAGAETPSERGAKRRMKLPPTRLASLCKLYHPETQGVLDSALVLKFDKTHSFTGEDLVELHTHGSRAVVRDVLTVLYQLSSTTSIPIRPADRGEFTQRAYAGGKLGLLEVEALADLITTDTSHQRRQARTGDSVGSMKGGVLSLFEHWRTPKP